MIAFCDDVTRACQVVDMRSQLLQLVVRHIGTITASAGVFVEAVFRISRLGLSAERERERTENEVSRRKESVVV